MNSGPGKLMETTMRLLFGLALLIVGNGWAMDSTFGQETATGVAKGCNCDLPYGVAKSLKPNSSTANNLAQETSSAGTSRQLAEANAKLRQFESDNLRLKLALQHLQLSQAQFLLGRQQEESAEMFPEANVLRDSVWASTAIPVSWENPSPENAEERDWVRAAISRTWEQESELEFTGWGPAEPNSPGIRIQIADAHPHCKRLGRHLNGVRNGMVLNFSFETWCPACLNDRRGAIEKIAIHEFGHALGFAHEQNRTDAPDWCHLETQGTDGDWYLTIYDPDSIMNYCNPSWNNNGVLSPLDIQAVRALYGTPSRSARTGDVRRKARPLSVAVRRGQAVAATKPQSP